LFDLLKSVNFNHQRLKRVSYIGSIQVHTVLYSMLQRYSTFQFIISLKSTFKIQIHFASKEKENTHSL